jgi:hypothetical protein
LKSVEKGKRIDVQTEDKAAERRKTEKCMKDRTTKAFGGWFGQNGKPCEWKRTRIRRVSVGEFGPMIESWLIE